MVSRFVNAAILGMGACQVPCMPNPDGSPSGPQQNPGEITNWPMLKITYRTDPEKIAALLPPGIEPGEPLVHITFYNVPVLNAPEYGVVVAVEAYHKGVKGEYTVCMGIDQEDPIYISHELWGEPKYQAHIPYFRMYNHIEAKVIHQGHTFLEFSGDVTGTLPNDDDTEQNDWWIKCLRKVDLSFEEYDFPPHVVRVKTVSGCAFKEKVEGKLVLHDSPWDPIVTYLPMREQVSAYLVTPVFKDRQITLDGQLDGKTFWPYADTIGGSRWPGEMGGPKHHIG